MILRQFGGPLSQTFHYNDVFIPCRSNLRSRLSYKPVDPLQQVGIELIGRLQLRPVPCVELLDREVLAVFVRLRVEQRHAHIVLLARDEQDRFGDRLVRFRDT